MRSGTYPIGYYCLNSIYPIVLFPKYLEKILSPQKYLEKNLKKNSKSIKHLEKIFIKLPILLNLLNMLPIFN
jgi:hypothetical protein